MTTRQEVFNHYLLLRTMALTDLLQSEKDHYLQVEEEWGSGVGHPWPLIHFYRGLLLQQCGRESEAIEQINLAIDLAIDSEHGSVLEWMALVFNSSQAHHLDSPTPIDLNSLKKRLPTANWERLEQGIDPEEFSSPRKWLEQLLPFNLH